MNESVIRIVRMTFHPEHVEEFLKMFDERSQSIRSFEGCRRLDLVCDTRFPNVLTTISVWTSEEALSTYRNSSVFTETWEIAKDMFADHPEAASHVLIRS